MRTQLCACAVLPLVLAACAGGGGRPEWTRGTNFNLVRVELDRAHLADRGQLPLFERPGDLEFGAEPWATGRLSVTLEGRVVCRVTVVEPRSDAPGTGYRHDIVVFSGFVSEEEDEVRLLQRPTERVRLGVTTRLRVQQESDGLLRVLTFTDEQQLPYVYWFAPPPALPRKVPVPYVSG